MTGLPNGQYPRELRLLEQELIAGVLPVDRPLYSRYASDIARMSVLAQGPRGRGHLILGTAGSAPDVEAPLSSVLAFGMVEFDGGSVSIAVHMKTANEIHVELMPTPGEELPVLPPTTRRWTYSTWSPGMTSPCSEAPVREISVTPSTTLVLAEADKRIWLHDAVAGTNQMIPITTFHGELMKVEKISDPAIVLKPGRFFGEMNKYNDESVRRAFLAYNEIHPKSVIDPAGTIVRRRRSSLLYRLLKFGLDR